MFGPPFFYTPQTSSFINPNSNTLMLNITTTKTTMFYANTRPILSGKKLTD